MRIRVEPKRTGILCHQKCEEEPVIGLMTALLTAGIASGQTQSAQMAAEIQQLKIELTLHLLDSEETKMRRLEKRVARIAMERSTALAEENQKRADVQEVDAQISRPEVSEEERSQLESLRSGPLAEMQATLRRQQAALAEQEATLRRELEERRVRLKALRQRLEQLEKQKSVEETK